MAKVWITYSWNDTSDVDFIHDQLLAKNIEVGRDKWVLSAGQSVWDQIGAKISTDECDGLIFYTTQSSLQSKPCREELSYAVTEALKSKGPDFPIIGVFPGQLSYDLIPKAISSRLYVFLTDPQWLERIVAALEKRPPNIGPPVAEPYHIQVHNWPYAGSWQHVVEIRPRAETWSPPMVAIPLMEKERVQPFFMTGRQGRPPESFQRHGSWEAETVDGQWWVMSSDTEVTPTRSAYILCAEIPSSVAFGVVNGTPNYKASVR